MSILTKSRAAFAGAALFLGMLGTNAAQAQQGHKTAKPASISHVDTKSFDGKLVPEKELIQKWKSALKTGRVIGYEISTREYEGGNVSLDFQGLLRLNNGKYQLLWYNIFTGGNDFNVMKEPTKFLEEIESYPKLNQNLYEALESILKRGNTSVKLNETRIDLNIEADKNFSGIASKLTIRSNIELQRLVEKAQKSLRDGKKFPHLQTHLSKDDIKLLILTP
jgi:hypothetical protein